MTPHSSTLAWKIPGAEEPGRLQSMGSLRVGHDWVTSLSLSRIGEGNDNPLQCSCLENPRDRGAWWAAVYGVAQSRTRLKRLSSSSNSIISWKVNGTGAVFIVSGKAKWPLRKIVWQFFTQLNQLLPYDSVIMHLGIYPCELKTCLHTPKPAYIWL